MGRPGLSKLHDSQRRPARYALRTSRLHDHPVPVRPVDQAHRACSEIHRSERRQVGDAERAVDLMARSITRAARARHRIYERDLDPRLSPAFEAVRGLERQEPAAWISAAESAIHSAPSALGGTFQRPRARARVDMRSKASLHIARANASRDGCGREPAALRDPEAVPGLAERVAIGTRTSVNRTSQWVL